MPAVFRKKGSQFWHYDFRLRGRGRFHGSTELTRKADAQRWLDNYRAALILGQVEQPQMTIDVASLRYWREVAERQPSAKTTFYQLRNLVEGFGPASLLSEITDDRLTKWIAERRGKKHSRYKNPKAAPEVSSSTVNREIELLRRVLYRARDVWKVATPSIRWKSHRLKEPRVRDRVLTEDEEARLFPELAPHLVAPVTFSLRTGLRLSNVMRLDWSQIDLQARRIHIVLKGDRTLVLPITPDMLVLLANQGPKEQGRVFLRDGQPIRSWRTAWEAALRRAGIEGFRWHDLRHTMASRLVAKGKDIGVVSKALGHSSITTTMRYAHYNEEAIRAALGSLDAPAAPQSSRSGTGSQRESGV